MKKIDLQMQSFGFIFCYLKTFRHLWRVWLKCPNTFVVYLILYWHDQNSSDFQQDFHIVLVVLLNSSSTVYPVILVAVWRNLQTVLHDKVWFADLKPEMTHFLHWYYFNAIFCCLFLQKLNLIWYLYNILVYKCRWNGFARLFVRRPAHQITSK